MTEEEAIGQICFNLFTETRNPSISASTAIFLPTVKNIQEILEHRRGDQAEET